MKSIILRIEFLLLRLPPFFWLVFLVDVIVRRFLWVWGRVRFGALVKNRGLGCVCHWAVDLKYPGNIYLGERVVIGVNASLGAHSPIRIGDYVRISRDAQLETASLDFNGKLPPYAHTSQPITIDKGVWVGSRATILGGGILANTRLLQRGL